MSRSFTSAVSGAGGAGGGGGGGGGSGGGAGGNQRRATRRVQTRSFYKWRNGGRCRNSWWKITALAMSVFCVILLVILLAFMGEEIILSCCGRTAAGVFKD